MGMEVQLHFFLTSALNKGELCLYWSLCLRGVGKENVYSLPHSPLSIHSKNLLYRIPVTLENANRLLTNKSILPGKEMRNLDTAVL